MKLKNILPYALSLALLGGSVFAWYTVYQDLSFFYTYEKTIFKIQYCVVRNPVTTPCFWGAFAFVISFIWSLILFRLPADKKSKQNQYLMYFLIGGTIFAWTNMALEFIRWFQAGGQPHAGCSGAIVSNPFLTPCFIGSTVFLLSLLIAVWMRMVERMGEKIESSNRKTP